MRPPLACAAAIVLASLVEAAPSQAQQARDPALAEQLFNSAQACLAKDDWACACAKFGASMSADPSVSTQINVARCHEHDGKLTLAWATLHDALKLNRAMAYPDESRRIKLGDYAQKALDTLERKVPKLRIVVSARPERLTVRRGGAVIPLAALDEPIRVDPGEHEITADAPGFVTARRTVALTEGRVEEVVLTLSRVAPAPSDAGPTAAPAAPPPSEPAPNRAPPPPPPSRVRSTVGWVGVGVGSAGLLTAGILGVVTLAKSKSADGSDACKSPVDNARILECNGLRDGARGIQTAGIVTAVASGVLAGVGVALVATAARPSPATGLRGPSFTLVAHPAGASLLARY